MAWAVVTLGPNAALVILDYGLAHRKTDAPKSAEVALKALVLRKENLELHGQLTVRGESALRSALKQHRLR